MSFEGMEGVRRDTVDSILAKFGSTIEKAGENAATKTSDPAKQKLMAARMALEYAVLATAREKNVATEVVAGALKGATVAQQAAMIKEGSSALGRAYRVEPEILANVFAGTLTDVNMPKGLASTPEIDKMIDTCRTLVTSMVKDEYAVRGQFVAGGRREGYVGLQSDGLVSPVKTELAARMAFMEASIDAAASKGAISELNASMLKERIEAQVFQPRPPQSLEFSKEFVAFFEQRGKGLRIESMTEVRGITQSQTVRDITAKLNTMLPAIERPTRPADHIAHKPMER